MLLGTSLRGSVPRGVQRAGGLKEGRLSQQVRGEDSAGELSGELS